ncbi:MAG: hypothetical protein J7L71_00075 [Spirochaetaceae bacterium]|nr:hypothetical protein [Spirochaetaceae bacterium]
MTKVDFMFTIGYQGVSAIVDKHAKKQYSKLSSTELAEKGLFKSAFCEALFDEDIVKQKEISNIYNRISGEAITNVDSMKRLLGVFEVPSHISRVRYI